MRFSKRFAAVLTVVLLSATAHAAELYVANSGNDAGTGTIASPFKTVSRAASLARPGDVVNVRGGVYFERVRIMSKGTASARILFRSYPGETAIVDGTGLPSDKATVAVTEAEYVDVANFEVRNSPFIGISLWASRQIRVLDNTVHGAVRNGIYVGADTTGIVSDITISGNTVYNTVLENQYRTMGGSGWAGAVVVAYTERATITNNRIRNNDGEGLISLRSNNATIADNVISDNFSVELYIDNARFVTATRNLIFSTGNTRYYRNGYPAAGIAVANETNTIMNLSSDNVFSNNIVVGSRWGFYYGSWETGGGLRNTQVVNNTFYGTKQAIIEIEDDAHANSVVQNNIFYSAGSPAPRYAGTNGVAYSNNLWYGTTSGAAAGTADLFADPLFVNAGGLTAADYKVKPGSGAIGKAVDASNLVSTDYFGARRAQPFDIGAHQFSVAGAVLDLLPPSVPAGLRADGGNSASVKLVWDPSTDNVGVTRYAVIRNNVEIAIVAAPTWVDTTVVEDTVYEYQVAALDAAGNRSALSAVLSLAWASNHAVTDTIAPDRPAKLTGGATSATTAGLAWTAATDNVGVAAYEVYRDNVRIGVVTGLSFNDSGLSAGTAYAYHVVAVDEAGNASIRSNKVSVSMAGANRTRAARR